MFLYFAYADRQGIDAYLKSEKRKLFLPAGGEFEFDLPAYMWDVLEAHAAYWRFDIRSMIANMVYENFEIGGDADARRRRYLVASVVDCLQQHMRHLLKIPNDNGWRTQARNMPDGSRMILIHNMADAVHHGAHLGMRARFLVNGVSCSGLVVSAPDWIAPIRQHNIAKKHARQKLGAMNLKEQMAFTNRMAAAVAEAISRVKAKGQADNEAAQYAAIEKAEKLKAALTAAFFSDTSA